MKPSHFSTPRQMRDANWTSGSVSATQSGHPSTLVIALIAVAACLLVVFGVIP